MTETDCVISENELILKLLQLQNPSFSEEGENGAEGEGDDEERDEESGRQKPKSAIETGAQEESLTRPQNRHGSGPTWHLRRPPYPVRQQRQRRRRQQVCIFSISLAFSFKAKV